MKRNVYGAMSLSVFSVIVAYLMAAAPSAHADVPYICYQPQHINDMLCAGAQSVKPPGYTLSDPGTWQPWPKYSTNPHQAGTP